MQPNPVQEKPQPPQAKIRKFSRKVKSSMNLTTLTPIEMAKAALPIYGGTTPDPATPAAVIIAPQNPPEESNSDPKTEDKPEDPVEKLSKDPQALGQLLAQVDKLTKDLTTTKTKVSEYETKEAETQRKSQTREQQLEADLADRDATIAKMDAVIHNMAIGNAILSQKDVQWHSLKQVLAELNPEAFDIDVDLENGTARVSGIDHEVKRIAKDCPWLVAKAADPVAGQQTRSRPPSSGTPPAPPGGDAGKQARRNDLMKKFPVIAQGLR